MVFIGDKNQELKQQIMDALRKAGFRVSISRVPGLRGISAENICNRCKSGKGVQLEISRGLREKMYESIDRRSMRKKTGIFDKFVDSIRMAVRFYNAITHCYCAPKSITFPSRMRK
jgi:phage replication-related protein YjqB (UPF0714/DUF867 family)